MLKVFSGYLGWNVFAIYWGWSNINNPGSRGGGGGGGAGLVGGASYNFWAHRGQNSVFIKTKYLSFWGLRLQTPLYKYIFSFNIFWSMFRNVQYPWVASHLESLPTFL